MYWVTSERGEGVAEVVCLSYMHGWGHNKATACDPVIERSACGRMKGASLTPLIITADTVG